MKGKIEWRAEEPQEFIFQGEKYKTVWCENGVCCEFCEIGIKKCALHRKDIPNCSEFNRADGKDVYFKKID